jgi:hypothetical protein
MVTITATRDDNTENLVIVNTVEDAEAFLDRLAGSYWGIPGFTAKRDNDTLTIVCNTIGEGERVASIYRATPDAA